MSPPRAVPIEIFLNSYRMIRYKTTITANDTPFKNSFFKNFTVKDVKDLKQKIEYLFWKLIDKRRIETPTILLKEPAVTTMLPNDPQKLKFTKSFKKQFSAGQKRPNFKKNYPSSGSGAESGRFKKFQIFIFKSFIAGGLVYGSFTAGIWGSVHDTESFLNNIKSLFEINTNKDEILISNKIDEVTESYNSIIKSFIVNIKSVPQSVSEIYDKTEKYVKEVIETKK